MNHPRTPGPRAASAARMSRRRTLAVAVLAVAGFAAVAVATLPATRMLHWAGPPGMEATGVSGSAWSGRAQRVALGGPAPLEDLRWDVAAWRLVLGRLAADLEFGVAGLAVDGRFAASPGGRLRLDGVTIAGPAAAVAWLSGAPFLGLGGSLDARVEAAVIERRRPRHLRGRFEWRGARLVSPVRLDLGDVRGRVVPGADGGHGLTLEARGGEVTLAGGGSLGDDGRYRLELTLTPARDAPRRVHDILAMIARPVDGRYVIRRSGTLRP